jgi:nitroreductase
VDTFLAIASKRDERSYADGALPEDVRERILDAGRVTGSAVNRQPWRFHVVGDRERVARLARAVFVPANVLGAALVVAVTVSGKGPTRFDAGRAAQNMMLAAWNDGVASCPNGIADAGAMAGALDLADGEEPAIVLSFGYPARPRDPHSHPADEWIDRAQRRPRDEVVRRV